MMIEKAIRLARKWAAGHVCTLKEGEAQEYHQMCAEALEKSRWISVENRLPEQRDGYLVATEDGDVYDAEFIPGVKQWWIGDEWRLDITHWMPLPLPPTESENG